MTGLSEFLRCNNVAVRFTEHKSFKVSATKIIKYLPHHKQHKQQEGRIPNLFCCGGKQTAIISIKIKVQERLGFHANSFSFSEKEFHANSRGNNKKKKKKEKSAWVEGEDAREYGADAHRDGMGWRSDGSSGTAALPDLAAGWRSAAGQVASRGESTPRGLSLSPYLSLFFENKKQK